MSSGEETPTARQGERQLVVNGQPVAIAESDVRPLARVLRDSLDLRATKVACAQGECGACTVLVGEIPMMSCVTSVALVSEPVTTLEGLTEEVTDLREEFAERGAFQCGFCTPGQLVHAAALLRQSAGLAERNDLVDYVRSQLSGNICRCTGYQAITQAVCSVICHRAKEVS